MCCRSRKEHQTRLVTTGLLRNMSLSGESSSVTYLCFRVFGEDRITAMNIQVGEELRVSFDVDAREYQGRWYNTLTAWKVERIDPAAAAQGPLQPDVQTPFAPQQPATPFGEQPAAQAGDGATDDLPF